MKLNWIRLAIVYASIILFAIGSIVYTNSIATQNERKFCNVINTVVTAYETHDEPLTDLGRKLKSDYLELQRELGCQTRP